MDQYRYQRKKRIWKIALTLLMVLVFAIGIGIVGMNVMELKAAELTMKELKKEAGKLGIIRRTSDNYGHILFQLGDYSIVQAGETMDLYEIPPGEKNIYIYRNLDYVPVMSDMGPMLKGNLQLVNKTTKFKANEPVELSPVAPSKKYSTKKDYKLQSEALANMEDMLGAAYRDGYRSIRLNSTYRGVEDQKKLFASEYKRWKNKTKDAYEKVNKKVAKAGFSEHHTGLAIDVAAGPSARKEFRKIPFYKWMQKNAYQFGFIERYPKGKEEITDFQWEYWHYRYVGVPFSNYIWANKLSFEEFVEQLRKEKILNISYAARDYHLIYLKGVEKLSVQEGFETDGRVRYEVYKLTTDEAVLAVMK
mgnify:CR=1 FL=1